MPSVHAVLALAALLAPLPGATGQQTKALPPGVEESSCRAFVQGFYDTYWNRFADRARKADFNFPGLDEVLSRNPPVLSRRLIQLIRKDEAESRRTGDVGNLDFDPFLNSQDPDGVYRVSRVAVSDGKCMATVDRAQTVAELVRSGNAWLIVNLHYSYVSADGKRKESPDDDLVHILGSKN